MRTVIISITAIATIALTATTAHADRRAFANVYEYMTMPEGDLELEFYNTQSRDTFDPESARSFESQVEVEYGITNRWDISLYQTFAQSMDPAAGTSTGLNYTKTKLRTRYRFGERGELPVDVLVYFEVQKAFGSGTWVVEPKLILARDFGKVTVAVNLIPEVELEEELEITGTEVEAERELELEPGWALGATYELSPKWKLGAEWFGAVGHPFDDAEVETWVGPSASWAPSPKLWATANAGFGLTEHSSDLRVRFILGVGI